MWVSIVSHCKNARRDFQVNSFSTWRLHVAWMYKRWVCTRAARVRRTLTLTRTITAYSVSGNVVRVRILICATRQKPCRKRVDQTSTEWPSMCQVGYYACCTVDPLEWIWSVFWCKCEFWISVSLGLIPRHLSYAAVMYCLPDILPVCRSLMM